MIRAAFLLGALAVSACAMDQQSYVAAVQSGGEAQTIADGIALFTSQHARPGPIALDPTPAGQDGNAVTAALGDALRASGFTIAPRDTAPHRLRYLVTPLDAGELVRITIDDAVEGARLLARQSGRLVADGPLTVRTAEASS